MRLMMLGLTLVVGAVTGWGAVTRSELSPLALELLPPPSAVIKMKGGTVVQGELLAAESTTNQVVICSTSGKIVSRQRYPRADILEIRAENLEGLFANTVRGLHISPKTNLTAEAYVQGVTLLEEFLKLWPASSEAKWIAERRAEFAGEQKKLARGLEKLDGEWMPPIKASVTRYSAKSSIIQKAQKQYPGVESPLYVQYPKIKKAYEQVLEERRAIARRLPLLMTERIPVLLQEKDFDQAVTEMDTFLRFWVGRVTKNRLNRANAVKGALVSAGVPISRLEASSFGNQFSASDASAPMQMRLDRRVEMWVLPQ